MLTCLALPVDSWYRVFHRTKAANGAIAMNVLRAIEKYQADIMQQPAPSVTLPGGCHNGPQIGEIVTADPATAATAAPDPPPSSVPKAPYSPTGDVGENKKDRCHAHIVQKWDCLDKITAAVQLWDAAGGDMAPLSDDRPLADPGSTWKSKLENELSLKGDKNKINFALGGSGWTTDDRDQTKDNWCSVGGYDPHEPQGLGACQDAVSFSILLMSHGNLISWSCANCKSFPLPGAKYRLLLQVPVQWRSILR